jgi:glutamate formiminotransferase
VTTLNAVPNFSEGRDDATIDAIGAAIGASPGVHVLAEHRDADHNRCVFSLVGAPGALAPALLAGARVALERIDLGAHDGVHPHVGVLDVAPIAYMHEEDRGAACAEALLLGDLLGGGPAAMAQRMAAGELTPDFGPRAPHPRGGTTLVGARLPLVAFNVTLKPPATLEQAREIAARIREGGEEGLPGLRAIGLRLERQGTIQVSMNVEQPDVTPLSAVVAAVARHAPVADAELICLAPEISFAGFPADLSIPGFDPDVHLIERALARLGAVGTAP